LENRGLGRGAATDAGPSFSEAPGEPSSVSLPQHLDNRTSTGPPGGRDHGLRIPGRRLAALAETGASTYIFAFQGIPDAMGHLLAVINIIAMLIVLISLVGLVNLLLALFPDVAG
jgi:hypothetical protein